MRDQSRLPRVDPARANPIRFVSLSSFGDEFLGIDNIVIEGTAGPAPTAAAAIRGDADRDGDVPVADFMAIMACFARSNAPAAEAERRVKS